MLTPYGGFRCIKNVSSDIYKYVVDTNLTSVIKNARTLDHFTEHKEKYKFALDDIKNLNIDVNVNLKQHVTNCQKDYIGRLVQGAGNADQTQSNLEILNNPIAQIEGVQRAVLSVLKPSTPLQPDSVNVITEFIHHRFLSLSTPLKVINHNEFTKQMGPYANNPENKEALFQHITNSGTAAKAKLDLVAAEFAKAFNASDLDRLVEILPMMEDYPTLSMLVIDFSLIKIVGPVLFINTYFILHHDDNFYTMVRGVAFELRSEHDYHILKKSAYVVASVTAVVTTYVSARYFMFLPMQDAVALANSVGVSALISNAINTIIPDLPKIGHEKVRKDAIRVTENATDLQFAPLTGYVNGIKRFLRENFSFGLVADISTLSKAAGGAAAVKNLLKFFSFKK